MPYVRIEPECFHEYKDVEVFHIYHVGSDDIVRYWFTTNPDTADDTYEHGRSGHFDVRQLVTGQWSEMPNVAQWEKWWKARFAHEEDCFEALIERAIDDGRLPTRDENP